MVGKDTIDVCLNILNNGVSMEGINNTNIALIPESQDPKSMFSFRSISLCNVIYKIVAKDIANRMKSMLETTISQTQAAFVPKRLISDNVLLGFECIHALNNKRKGKVGQIAMKIDMSKTYDRVEWCFIRRIMDKLGFSKAWIDKVMVCIESLKYAVLINGVPQETFTPKRGLRQGDPLSFYIFLLCVEGLSSLLNREEELDQFRGLKVNNHCPSLSHLFFADDSLIFCRATKKDCETIKRILKTYEKASGQTINQEKSSFMVSRNVNEDKMANISKILGMEATKDLGYYLRMPSQNGRNKNVVFRRLKERVWKALQCWKENLFSAGGKEVLINSVAQAIPTYTMSCFRLRNSICEEINKVCANFWWGTNKGKNKAHWMSWTKLCTSKDRGGLGFRELSLFN